MRFFLIILCFIINCVKSHSQQIKILTIKPGISLRGLSAVNDRVIWVSGSKGTVGKSIDGGNNWKWIAIKGFEKNEFRDIEAFDEMEAVIMCIGDPAYILRTIDGGDNWKIVFKDTAKGMFLDAMEFWNDQSGIAIGDPLNEKFFIARTFNGGRTWQCIPPHHLPEADKGEICFAASGTNLRNLNRQEAVFVSGGMSSNLFIQSRKIRLPIVQGKESAGANSIAIKNKKTFIIVGGDFNQKDSTLQNCIITSDGGKSWRTPEILPQGYRSCVEYVRKKEWITCGINGVDYTKNDGKTFVSISKEGFHVCRKAKKGRVVFLAGSDGRIGRME